MKMAVKTTATNGSEGAKSANPGTIATEPAAPNEAGYPHGTESRDGEVEGAKRRMPDNLRRYLIKMQGGKMYLPAAYRIVWFRDELGDDWGIRTQLVEGGHQAGFATVHAEVLNPEGRVIASGHKTEAKSDFPAGWVEKAESGAVARALALLGFGTQFTPELDDDGYRPADSPQPRHVYAPTRASEPARPAAAQPVHAPRTRDVAPVKAAAANGAPSVTVPVTLPQTAAGPVQEIWEGPGQCPRCHAPEGKRHGRQCLEA
jgi:hypothetical protein